MRVFSSIAGFFRARYSGFVQWVTTTFMNLTAGLLNHYVGLRHQNKLFLKQAAVSQTALATSLLGRPALMQDFSFVEDATAHTMTVASNLLRQHAILSGKNPDAPPVPNSAPVKETKGWLGDDPARAQQILLKFHGSKNPLAGEGQWIKNAKEHPVLKARAQFAEKQVAQAAHAALDAQLATKTAEPTELSEQEWAEIKQHVKPRTTAEAEEALAFVAKASKLHEDK